MSSLIGQSLGRYHILEQLGEGGMATVYKAYDPHLERNVAIKVILPTRQHSEKFLKRFEREARALAKLSHPNIIGVIDFGEQDGIPYLVMEYLPGGTLKHKTNKPMPWRDAILLLIPVARALAAAHKQGIIHRDVKPSNILLTSTGEPMLTDFGIAKIIEVEETVELTGAGVGIGTPEYMAPEQAQGKAIDGRADIYSLGIVLYELITGRKPYQADTPLAVIYKLASEPLPRPKLFVTDLPEAVEQLLIKVLGKIPAYRFENADEFVHALERLAVAESQKREGRPRGDKQEHRKYSRAMFLIVSALILIAMLFIGGRWLFLGGTLAGIFSKKTATKSQVIAITSTLPPIESPVTPLPDTPTKVPIPTSTSTAPNPQLHSQLFQVLANGDWQNTGVKLNQGDVVTIRYISGVWGWTGEIQHGANGDTRTCSEICETIGYSCPIQSANEGALVGRLGSNSFFIGDETSFTFLDSSTTEQVLELRMNDCDLGLQDNSGTIEVSVEVVSKIITTKLNGLTSDGESLFRWCTSDWTTCRNALQGNASWSDNTGITVGATYDSKGYTIQRGFFTFDTSVIPADATITNASLHIYIGPFLNGNTTIHVVKTSATPPITISDYRNIEYDSGGSITPSRPNSWVAIEIDSNHLDWIKPGQVAVLALIHKNDFDNTIPNSANDILISSTNDSLHHPYLEIMYSLP